MFDRQGGRKYLNDCERQIYFQTVSNHTDKLERAFCLTLFYTGCRISEALHLTAASVDPAQKCVVFETLKRRKTGMFRAVPVPDNFIALLMEIAKECEAYGLLWPMSRTTAYRVVKRFILQAGIVGSRACPKGLRHGFAIACIAENIPLPTVQKWLGHARLETTAIYTAASGEEERNLASRLWPKPLPIHENVT